MSERERDLKALRTIEVTARSALRYSTDVEDRGRVQKQAAILLENLERRVIAHGSDADVLAAIQYVRQGIEDYHINRAPTPPVPH